MSYSVLKQAIEKEGYLMAKDWCELNSTPEAPFIREDVDRWIHQGWLPYKKFFGRVRAPQSDLSASESRGNTLASGSISIRPLIRLGTVASYASL